MTPGEIQIHKEKIKKVMLDHLATVGWPKVSNDVVLRELKPMWIKIEEANLVLPGMNFQAFAGHANNQFMMAEVKDMLGI